MKSFLWFLLFVDIFGTLSENLNLYVITAIPYLNTITDFQIRSDFFLKLNEAKENVSGGSLHVHICIGFTCVKAHIYALEILKSNSP